MKRTFAITAVLVLLLVSKVSAQVVTAGAYGGVTTDKQFTGMVMADVGVTYDAEPWFQNYGSLKQVGVDFIATPFKDFGFTVGIYDNERTERAGLAYTIKSGQFRVLYDSNHHWSGIGYWNFYLNPTNYVQVWLAPAEGGSAYLVGFGHQFKN